MYRNVFRMVNDQMIRGKCLQAFLKGRHSYQLIDVELYEDSMVRLGERIQPWEQLEQAIKKGKIITHIPQKAEGTIRLDLWFLGPIEIKEAMSFVDEEEFLKEANDILARMHGQPNASALCQQAFWAFLVEPTEEHREQLRKAYNAIPEHNRIYMLGDQDVKDGPIRAILNGDISEEILTTYRQTYQRFQEKHEPIDIWRF